MLLTRRSRDGTWAHRCRVARLQARNVSGDLGRLHRLNSSGIMARLLRRGDGGVG